MNDKSIDEFLERIMSIRPNGFLGFNGASGGIVGSSNTGSDVTFRLQRSAIDFSQVYKSVGSHNEVDKKSDELRGLIMTEAAVGAIAQSRADELIQALQMLIKKRN